MEMCDYLRVEFARLVKHDLSPFTRTTMDPLLEDCLTTVPLCVYNYGKGEKEIQLASSRIWLAVQV